MIKVTSDNAERQAEVVAMAVRTARNMKGMSMAELALVAGVTPNTICNIENGKTFPTSETLNKMCEKLGMAVTITIE